MLEMFFWVISWVTVTFLSAWTSWTVIICPAFRSIRTATHLVFVLISLFCVNSTDLCAWTPSKIRTVYSSCRHTKASLSGTNKHAALRMTDQISSSFPKGAVLYLYFTHCCHSIDRLNGCINKYVYRCSSKILTDKYSISLVVSVWFQFTQIYLFIYLPHFFHHSDPTPISCIPLYFVLKFTFVNVVMIVQI